MNILFHLEKYGLLLPCIGVVIHKIDQSISTYFFLSHGLFENLARADCGLELALDHLQGYKVVVKICIQF